MKAKIFYWSLYDFANSFVVMAFLFYFSQWLVIDQGKPAWWYNGSLIISSALFILTAPIISRKIDLNKIKILGLRIYTVFSVIFFSLTSLLASFGGDFAFLATVSYTISNYFYLVCFLYFTPMLNDLSQNGNRALVSGIGMSANALGQVCGILFTLPFINGITLIGETGRAQALLPSVIAFLIFSLPMLFLYRENFSRSQTIINFDKDKKQKQILKDVLFMFKNIFSNKALAFIFIAYFLFSDAMLTFANNFPLYLEVVHGVSDNIKSILTAGILLMGAIGAIVFGKIADKFGSLKVLKIVITTWCFIFIAMSSISNFSILIPIFIFAGFLYGPVWGITRSIIGDLAPNNLEASSFSYYILVEKLASFAGPLLWSIILISFGENPMGYQVAIGSLAVILIISISVLNKVKYNIFSKQ